MHRFTRLLACLLAPAWLAACGGGGNGGASDKPPVTVVPGDKPPVTVAAGGDWLTIHGAALEIGMAEGQTSAFGMDISLSRTPSRPFNLGIVDGGGLIASSDVLAGTARHYSATMRSSSDLQPGTHRSTLELRACEDDPRVCAKPLEGSPWRLPLTINVKPKTDTSGRMRFAPAMAEITMQAGQAASLTVEASTSSVLGEKVHVALIDPAGILAAPVGVRTLSDRQFAATLVPANGLAPGVYTSKLEMRACADDAAVCHLPYAGSPWTLALKVTVLPADSVKPLPVLPQLGPWSTYRGNPAHTGYVPASFDPASFALRWQRLFENKDGRVTAPAHDNGLVFQGVVTYRGDRAALVAISEESGTEVWRTSLGLPFPVLTSHLNPPAAANGKVYLTSTSSDEASLWVFEQKTGKLLSRQKMDTQGRYALAPTVLGDTLYAPNGSAGGLSQFRAGSQQPAWSSALPAFADWTPAVDASHAYVYLDGRLYAMGVADGRLAYQVDDPDHLWPSYSGGTPVLSDNQFGFVSDSGRLVAFNLAKRTHAWTLQGKRVSTPSYAKGVLYLFNNTGNALEAYAPDSGKLLWTAAKLSDPADATWFDQLVVTDNLAFISSEVSTLAIDLASGKTVWRYALGGKLSISDRGMLYIVNRSGRVAAIGLQ
ncbi:PQQ-binding-like beta-propeller repeat protein [Massilia sp. DJPM01]|uniref:PQQ-binding-like beta-propeller repeat protein n=1 Tax=Massilia sp. DJPM01 TaxID=3024404 RepID=UPI00259EB865|nr:PQQ-binding-like beta-propeller repeat protein [Massilia sp. DJPM01]MDM5176815.1 PQQ-binding-like beta-propeller repeat protein [Massilia sp. DJPM01]